MLMIYDSSKSAKIVLSKTIFNVKNQLNFFKKVFFKEYQFKRPFFGKSISFFLNSIFEPLYFMKLCPIFDGIVGIEKRRKFYYEK